MRIALRAPWIILAFCFLTVVTQIGGLVYLFALILFIFIRHRFNRTLARLSVKTLLFVILYMVATLLIVPVIAKSFGRVPLPLTRTKQVQPLTIWTCLLNRHYVKPELRDLTYRVAESMQKPYPGTVINYLDANFPFIDGFPLHPHLSHNDGKKLDIAFLYRDRKTNKPTPENPSFIGYGASEGPLPGETDRPLDCLRKGYWQYGAMSRFMPLNDSNVFDGARTAALTRYFIHEQAIGKIFIEPHLKERLRLVHGKVRLHGCQAVRHDDHLHVQLR